MTTRTTRMTTTRMTTTRTTTMQLKIALQFDAVAPYTQQSTRWRSANGIWWVLAAFFGLIWSLGCHHSPSCGIFVWQLAAHTATMTTTTTTRIKLTSRNSISYLNATIHLYAFCSLHCFYVYWCCVDKNSTKSENGRIVPYWRFWTRRYGRCKTPYCFNRVKWFYLCSYFYATSFSYYNINNDKKPLLLLLLVVVLAVVVWCFLVCCVLFACFWCVACIYFESKFKIPSIKK